jgi:hypothetical protein
MMALYTKGAILLSMSSQDFLYYSLGIGFLVLVGFLSYTAFTLSKTLKNLTSIFEKVDDITEDVDKLKNIFKSGIVYLMNIFSKKGGDKNDKK